MEFIKSENGHNFFAFICEACGYRGELEIKEGEQRPFTCPEGCGAMYVQWLNPLSKQSDLMCVVKPVFVQEN